MHGMRYYYGVHTSIHIYTHIYTAPAQICTPLIVSRSLHSLANYIYIARCQVLQGSILVPSIAAMSGDWTDIDFKIFTLENLRRSIKPSKLALRCSEVSL